MWPYEQKKNTRRVSPLIRKKKILGVSNSSILSYLEKDETTILIVACDPLKSATTFVFRREKRKNKLSRDPIATTGENKKKKLRITTKESASTIETRDRCSTRIFLGV